ncbi:MAG: MBL fold metallo-hydrolase [Sulfobacillus acidophilus]|uniref:MBL fold metallo-hydrolase n=1 Tax=Sulfobacillus acidophilus TaxID=53633 RepID=A0A2T2WIU1_9FIRM|nr:MAG: MBL fold metallo-hydrolase [Sulfobacillus acidophilus]
MIWYPMNDPSLGCSSFIVGDSASGEGIVVDPLGAIGVSDYVLAAQDLGITVVEVVETHVHADHASCARELAAALGVSHGLSHRAPAQFPFHKLSEGDVLTVGSVTLTVWETPGHTPDSISLVVRDKRRGDDAWAVLTGDSLFVGDVGRPDLADADPQMIRRASHDQFHSVNRLMALPDFTEVWPAHYGASPCGGLFMDQRTNSTIGYERRYNPFLRIADAETFVEQQQRLLKPQPEEAQKLRAQNLGRSA